jgi:sugar transferase (PEP-CTERM system associated)
MIKLFNQHLPRRKVLFFAGECFFITLAIVLSLIIDHELNTYTLQPLVLFFKITLIITVYQVSLFFSDFYSSGYSWSYKKLTYRLFISLILASCILGIVQFIFTDSVFHFWDMCTILTISLLLLLPWRLFYSWFIHQDKYKTRVLILGSGKLARDLARGILGEQELSLHVEGFLSSDPALKGVSIVNPKVIGNMEELSAIVHRAHIGKIIVALEERRGNLPLDELLKFKSYGITIENGISYYEKISNQILVEYINPSDLIFCDGFKLSYGALFVKRAYDMLFACIGLIMASPLFLILSVLIKMESRGPIFYKQERVGKNEKSFFIYKFRSMLNDAEKKTGPVMALSDDKRITRIGKIIRKTRLDELPQLWNILKGDMSFVGPRPERPVFVEKFTKQIPFYGQRFALRPGLTGWAQIRCPYASTIEETLMKLRYELYYLKNFSFFFDLSIILRTVKVVLFARGI